MQATGYRRALVDYIRAQANPPDKFSHQARLYRLASDLGRGQTYDDDVLFAAVWLHDLGVFLGHRPEDRAALAAWDNVAYAMKQAVPVLKHLGFPREKIPAVVEVIRTHQPAATPTCVEGVIMRDADILEQLGAVGILRTASKVGRDTRFIRFGDALRVLGKCAEELPPKLKLESARREAEARVRVLRDFLAAAEAEAAGIEW